MLAFFLNPRVLASLALVAFLAFSHFTAYRKGASHVRLEWTAATAAANDDARRLEQARQRRADEAAKLAAEREDRLRADALAARRQSDGLRDDLRSVNEYASQSRAAAERATAVLSGVFGDCTRLLLEVSEAADRADNEARALRQAWPR